MSVTVAVQDEAWLTTTGVTQVIVVLVVRRLIAIENEVLVLPL